jgi:hypothetical protein
VVYVIKKLNLILIFSLLIFITLGAASAAEDANDTIAIEEIEITDIDESCEILSASQSVTPDSYGQYFDSNGQMIDSKVSSGDTLTFSGEFSNKNFTITKC